MNTAGSAMDTIKQQAEQANEEAKAFIRKHPEVTVLGAFALGLLVGKAVTLR